jgi:hypothetical protein
MRSLQSKPGVHFARTELFAPDHLSRKGRSQNMASIRSKDTKPELGAGISRPAAALDRLPETAGRTAGGPSRWFNGLNPRERARMQRYTFHRNGRESNPNMPPACSFGTSTDS